MNTSRTPLEIVESYSETGAKKAAFSAGKLIILGILAGAIIAIGSAATNTAVFSLQNISAARTVCGLLFPFGLAMVILLGAELFTGNSLMLISVFDRKCKVMKMLRNWIIVYFSNMLGAVLVAAACALFGQLNYDGGMLAVYTVKLAAAKCSLPFFNALVSGFMCNFLVCLGVMASMSAKDTAGRIMGAFMPVCYFVICGFEHSVANMYYISAGLFAKNLPQYADLIASAVPNLNAVTVSGFLFGNLLPVTLGNILGGAALSAILFFGHRKFN